MSAQGLNVQDYTLYRGYIGIMGKKMGTTIVYWGYIWFGVQGL